MRLNQFKEVLRVRGLANVPRAYVIALLGTLVVGAVTMLGVCAYLYYEVGVAGPEANAVQKQLEAEFGRIKVPPDTRALRYSSTHKGGQASVGSDYLSSADYADLRSHYDQELSRSGWKFLKEEPVKLWGKSHGGKQNFYCKPPYTATLEYAGDAANQLGWTHSFGLSWGLFDECH